MSMRSRNIVLIVTLAMALFIGQGQCLAGGKVDLNQILSQGKPVLLEFGRGWCKPCKYMKPILDDMAKAYNGRAIVMTVDMDANMDLVRNFSIVMMPTQVFLTADGKEFHRNMGIMERPEIISTFSKMGLPAPGN